MSAGPRQPSAARPQHNVHATALQLGEEGILIRGRSRSGKSALALSVLRRAELVGLVAALVADDQIFLEVEDSCVFALAPETIRGLIEVSGVGVLCERSVDRARLTLVVDLLEPDEIQRMPEIVTAEIAGIVLRRIALPARQASFGADVLQGLVMSTLRRD